MANFNTKVVSKAEEQLKLAHEDLIAFGKLFYQMTLNEVKHHFSIMK